MLLTENQARDRWCPQSQVAVAPAGDIHVNTLSGSAVTCAASGCMAWRWAERPAGIGARRESPGYGYCGLAGIPMEAKR